MRKGRQICFSHLMGEISVWPNLWVYVATYFHINEKKVTWTMLYPNHKVTLSHTWKPQLRKKTSKSFATTQVRHLQTYLEGMILLLTILQQAPFCHNPMTPFPIASILWFSIQGCQDPYMLLSSGPQVTLWRSTAECLQCTAAWSYQKQAPYMLIKNKNKKALISIMNQALYRTRYPKW